MQNYILAIAKMLLYHHTLKLKEFQIEMNVTN